MYLAGAGVRELTVVDADVVEEGNLHRQPIHAGNLGMRKAVSAARFVARLNPDCRVRAVAEALSPANAPGLLRGQDCVVDATDNPAARYLLSDTCRALGVPLVAAAAIKASGGLFIFFFQGERARARRAPSSRIGWRRLQNSRIDLHFTKSYRALLAQALCLFQALAIRFQLCIHDLDRQDNPNIAGPVVQTYTSRERTQRRES